MFSRSIRVSFVAATLAAFVGCDPNSGGPAAPSAPVANADSGSVPAEKTTITKQGKAGTRSTSVEGPKPVGPQ